MKRLVVLLVVAVAAVVLPAATSGAQPGALVCESGVALEGRCVSVDGQPSQCLGDACVEFVEESIDICPVGTTDVGSDPVTDVHCELIEAAAQRPPSCPEGARGEAGDCFIYVAIGEDGCPSPSVLDVSGNCRRPVADARAFDYCENADAFLAGSNCISYVDAIPSPCPAGTDRFDGACWQLNGLIPPESCDGHEAGGTTELASGLCYVPLPIPTGPATCVDDSVYGDYPSIILINQSGETQGYGESRTACVDTTEPVGQAVTHCFFPDDERDWGDYGDPGLCTRFETPVVVTCPGGYSLDDSVGGLCQRFEPAVNGECPEGGMLNSTWCVFGAEFAEFECPTDTTRNPEFPVCVGYRTWQGAISCAETASLIETVLPGGGVHRGCFAHVGPQPDQCNGEGTIELCFEILEPAPVVCGGASGCVMLGGEATSCAGRLVTIDMNEGGVSGIGTTGADVILGTPGHDVIRGLGGDDVICGGDGRDRIFGGPGNDMIYGGFGIDYLVGDEGADTIDGQGGSDRMFGGPDNDLMLGNSGADRMHGGAGDDEMRGMGGQDFMWGDGGNDLMQGNFQTDNLFGGPGDDTMFGAGGKDSLFGEGGDDTLVGGSNTDYLNGGDGIDTANGGRGRDKPLTEPQVRPGNRQIHGGSGCIAETILNCQPTP